MSRRNSTMDAFRGAFEEGYVQGAHHSRGASLILEAQRISMAYWERVREEAEAKFPSPVSASAPSREAGPGTPIKRCNKPVNDGRHLCRFPDGHEGECRAHVNAPTAPLASLGERPDADFAAELRTIANEFDSNEYGPHWRTNRDAANDAANEFDALRAELAALRSSLQEARADSERWRYIRQFLIVDRWELSPATTLNARMFKVPPIRGRSDATVDEIIDAAVRAAPLVEREESRR